MHKQQLQKTHTQWGESIAPKNSSGSRKRVRVVEATHTLAVLHMHSDLWAHHLIRAGLDGVPVFILLQSPRVEYRCCHLSPSSSSPLNSAAWKGGGWTAVTVLTPWAAEPRENRGSNQAPSQKFTCDTAKGRCHSTSAPTLDPPLLTDTMEGFSMMV